MVLYYCVVNTTITSRTLINEIQTNEAYSQSISLQPHLSQDPHLVSYFDKKILISGSTKLDYANKQL